MTRLASWKQLGACVGKPPDWWFPLPSVEDGNVMYARARLVCNVCPVKKACLDYAFEMETHGRFGMYGGTTPKERNRMRRKKAA